MTLITPSPAPARYPFQVRVYIDDFEVSARGPTSRHVVDTLARAAHLVGNAIEQHAQATISLPKASTIASTAHLAQRICTARGGKALASATVLGVDTTAGRSRCAARRSTRLARMRTIALRRRRFCRIIGASRACRATKFFVSG